MPIIRVRIEGVSVGASGAGGVWNGVRGLLGRQSWQRSAPVICGSANDCRPGGKPLFTSVLATSRFFGNSEASFTPPEHHGVLSDSVASPLPSVLLRWDFFASREDFFATPEHSDIFSDSARSLSPLCSQRRVADDTNHLTRFGCGRKAALCSQPTSTSPR